MPTSITPSMTWSSSSATPNLWSCLRTARYSHKSHESACTVLTDYHREEEVQINFTSFRTNVHRDNWTHLLLLLLLLLLLMMMMMMMMLPVFQLVQQCRDYSCNVTNIVVEPPSPASSPDSEGCTPVRKRRFLPFKIKTSIYEYHISYCDIQIDIFENAVVS